MENKHTISDLYQMQSLPLSGKLALTEARIRGWVDEYGEDGVYVSFSGGKDSTVLLDIVRNRMGYKDIPAVFVDVPTQFLELKEFANTWDNVVILHPEMSFKQVCEKYGFPMVSKQVARYIEGARRWKKNNPNGEIKDATVDYKIMLGKLEHKEKGILTDGYSKTYDKSRYAYMLDAPFDTSPKCCTYLKKKPLKKYAKDTGRKPITGQTASESRLRTMAWLKNGCNSFDAKEPISNPLSFWTEQDILLYIKENNIPICSVYGEIVSADFDDLEQIKGQINVVDLGIFDKDRPLLKTTGCQRTGCMLCGFGACSNDDTRFVLLKENHKRMYSLLDAMTNNGVTMREAFRWMNEHGNHNIKGV